MGLLDPQAGVCPTRYRSHSSNDCRLHILHPKPDYSSQDHGCSHSSSSNILVSVCPWDDRQPCHMILYDSKMLFAGSDGGLALQSLIIHPGSSVLAISTGLDMFVHGISASTTQPTYQCFKLLRTFIVSVDDRNSEL